MRLLIAPLQPNPRPSTDLTRIQSNSIIPTRRPRRLARGPEPTHLLKELLVRVTLVARRNHQGVHLEHLLGVGGIVLGGLDVDAHAMRRVVVLDAGDLALGQDAVLPGGFVGVPDALEVHCVVNFFDELEADDRVVCGFFFGDAGVAFFVGELEEFFYSLWVEDLVDAGIGC